MVLTTYFTTKQDWQHPGRHARVSFSNIRKLYQTAIKNGLSVTVAYDRLPREFIDTYASQRFRFVEVNLTEFDSRYGLNDVRYFIFHRLLSENLEWKSVFIVDGFDVRSGMNPCSGIDPGKIYVGSEPDWLGRLKNNWFLNPEFQRPMVHQQRD